MPFFSFKTINISSLSTADIWFYFLIFFFGGGTKTVALMRYDNKCSTGATSWLLDLECNKVPTETDLSTIIQPVISYCEIWNLTLAVQNCTTYSVQPVHLEQVVHKPSGTCIQMFKKLIFHEHEQTWFLDQSILLIVCVCRIPSPPFSTTAYTLGAGWSSF